MSDPLPVTDYAEIRKHWSGRVEQSPIRRLYEADASGTPDPELIDEVGCALLLRCETIQTVTERRCPMCRNPLDNAFAEGRADRKVTCPECRWTANPWANGRGQTPSQPLQPTSLRAEVEG